MLMHVTTLALRSISISGDVRNVQVTITDINTPALLTPIFFCKASVGYLTTLNLIKRKRVEYC